MSTQNTHTMNVAPVASTHTPLATYRIRTSKIKSLTGFTLVELIVVITILVILGTIAFVSLSGFSGSARDSSRVSDLSLISKGLDIHYTKLWSFPAPTSATGITFGSSSSIVWYQGTIGEWVIRSLGWAWARISTKPVDPLSSSEYRYSLPTGVNEYLLAADYEGDSVALLQKNWELRAQNWGLERKDGGDSVIASRADARRSNTLWGTGPGEHNRASDHTNKDDLSWIASSFHSSQWHNNPLATEDSFLATFNLSLATPASASTGSPTISYLKGTYNNVATRVSSGSTINIIALPSIFIASGSTGTIVDASSRNFLLQGKTLSGVSFAPKVVYSSWALPSNDTERLIFSSGIIAAYSGTALATNSDIKSFIDNISNTGSLSAVGGNFVRNKFGGNGPSIVVSSVASSTATNITNSLMFNGTNSYLSRSSYSITAPWSFSVWVKRSKLGAISPILGSTVQFNANDTLTVGSYTSTALYRDPSAWYHIFASAGNIYVNGVKVGTVTNPGFSNQSIGTDGTNYFGWYLADFHLGDNQAWSIASLGQFDSTTNQWTPASFSGSYGTNGSHLDFSSGSLTSGSNTWLWMDSSINGNYWNTNGISVAGNWMIDTPVNNFATLNPLNKMNWWGSNQSFSNGNLTATAGAATQFMVWPTIGLPSSEKYYIEWTIDSSSSAYVALGIFDTLPNNIFVYVNTTWLVYVNNINVATVATSAVGDTVRIAVDMNSNTATLYKNNTLLTTQSFVPSTTNFFGQIQQSTTTMQITTNFGQWGQDFTTGNRWASAPYSDDGWIGKFRYQPPTWFKALSTANLPDPAIKNPKQYFDVLTYTGNGSSQSITNLWFQPDLVWLKDRTSGNNHGLWDSTRLATKYLMSNSGAVEVTNASSLTSFLSNGFSLGSSTWWNTNGNSYVGWNWKKWPWIGVNGPWFDIVTYTGTETNRTVSHGLWAAPNFMIMKNYSYGYDWIAYHTDLSATKYIIPNTAAGSGISALPWNNSPPTSTGFSLGAGQNANGNGNGIVAYLWSEVPGFSKFGSYTGNGSATGDGSFVYTGFKPRFILLKNADQGYNWVIFDTARNAYNWSMSMLQPNTAAGEDPNWLIDILSNGFKIKDPGYTFNSAGKTIIYAAFAEAPFKYATAR